MRTIGVFCAVSLVLLTGCQTYGGHGSEEAAQVEIQNALDRYALRADRMRGDQRALANAAAESPRLAVFAPKLARIIEAQEATMKFNQWTADRLTGSPGYRELSRALGGIISEQQIVDDQYGRLLAEVQATLRPGLSKSPTSHYSLAPAFYARIEASLEQVPIRDAVR